MNILDRILGKPQPDPIAQIDFRPSVNKEELDLRIQELKDEMERINEENRRRGN